MRFVSTTPAGSACAAILLLIGWPAAPVVSLSAQERKADLCQPAHQTDSRAVLSDALRALGAVNRGDSVLHLRIAEATVEDYQSDRSYPPFFLGVTTRESWYHAGTGVLRSRGRIIFPDGEYDVGETLNGSKATFSGGDTIQPAALSHGSALSLRALDPWPVLYDWSTSEKVTLVGHCQIRDYPRIVLERNGPYGRERLAIDGANHLPVSLRREEPHYLWGQISVEYVYSNWSRSGGVVFAGSSFRMVDGAAEMSRTVAAGNTVPRDSAPTLTLPDSQTVMPPMQPRFLQPTPPDSVRVSDGARLLVNRGYIEGVALVGDTIYLLDATQGEERARADSSMIARLFPGRHPLVLVVTDLAWPHIAGVRYWVARGATVVSHRISRPFIERVLARRWTRAPDLYERRRAQARFVFKPVSDSLALAGGKLKIYAIDGIGSEGALMAYLEGDRFLWASDYIQTIQQPSTYATDVWRAVQRAGVRPSRVAAQHLPLTDWGVVDSLAQSGSKRDAT
jgi:hypothetical protein